MDEASDMNRADGLGGDPPPSTPAERLSTDEVLQVLEHLVTNPKGWDEIMADHGLDPVSVRRALLAAFGTGNGIHEASRRAFVLGLQFGAMRLPPFEDFKPPECPCLFCVLRRQVEAEAGEGEAPA